MRSDLAFTLGEVFRNNPMKVFDWSEAVSLIKTLKLKNAWAGLIEDWDWTSGKILENGSPYIDRWGYLASTWATPVLIDDNGNAYECWCWEYECEWNCDTKWPFSAVLLMMEKKDESFTR